MYHISVVIPTYNRAKCINNSIRSVIKQEGQGELYNIYEILVIDDGSTDNTKNVISDICDNRVKYIRLEQNSGAAEARNVGVRMAEGDWIAFQDSDDQWHADKLEKQVEYLRKHADVFMVSHPISALFSDGTRIQTEVIEDKEVVPYLAERNYYDTPTILVNKDKFLEAGGFNNEMKALEDWEFALRFADKFGIGMVSDVLIESDMISDGISSDASKYYDSRCKMIAWNKDILIRHGCFDNAVKSLFVHAENNGVFDIVGRMLELNLRSL